MNWYFLKKTTFSNSDHCIRYVHTYSTYTHAFKRYDKYVYDDNIHRHKVFKIVNKVFFKSVYILCMSDATGSAKAKCTK